MEPNATEKWLYFALGKRPAARHRDWTERDIRSKEWQLRRAAQFIVTWGISIVMIGVIWDAGTPSVLGAATAGLITTVIETTVLGDHNRLRVLRRYRKAWDRSSMKASDPVR
jgi:hypothetical protein